MESSGDTEENELSSLMRKSKILTQFLIEHEGDEYAKPFIEHNDVGFPLARFIYGEIARPLPKAYEYINATYAMLLDVMEVSENDVSKVDNLDDIIAFVENKKQKNTL